MRVVAISHSVFLQNDILQWRAHTNHMTWLGTKLGPWTLDKTRDLSVEWFKDLILGWDSRYSTVINTQVA